MSLRDAHRFVYTGREIAEAADALAEELLLTLSEAAAQELRDELLRQVGEEIDLMLMGWRFGDTVAGDPDPPVSIRVRRDLWQRYSSAEAAFREKRVRISQLVAAAARYRSQGGREFELDERDIAYFRLDRS